MRPLDNHLLVEAWDRGSGQSPLGRALTMLACAFPERSRGDVAALSIPERDLELLRLRRLTFGDSVRGFIPCDSCGASLEFETQVSSLLSRLETAQQPGSEARPDATWQVGSYRFSMRLANSADLAAAVAAPEPLAARRILLQRCISVSRVDSGEPEPEDAASERIALEKFEEIHQGAEIVLTLCCPSCRQNRKAELDVAQFLWAEIRVAAITLLRDVHELARVYGWAEAAILTMTGTRRKAYLEMARS